MENLNSDKIRLMFLIGQLSTGGTERQLSLLLDCLDRSVFEPIVVCLNPSQDIVQGFNEASYPIHYLDSQRNGRLVTLLQVHSLIRKFHPNIIHSFSYANRAAVLGGIFYRNSKKIISFRTNPARWVSYWDKVLFNFADLIIENSQFALMTYLSTSKYPIKKTSVVRNGISITDFDNMSNECITFPEGAEKEAVVIGYVSTLRPVKRTEDLLEAFAILQKKHSCMQLWIIGDGEKRPSLQEMVVNLKIKDKVIFWGMQTNIPAILKWAKLGVLCSENEGLPNSIVEYMCAGLPVVATDVGGISEVVENNQTGFLVPFGDVKQLSDAILFFLQNPDVSKAYGLAGRKRIEAYFTLEGMVNNMENLYKEILS